MKWSWDELLRLIEVLEKRNIHEIEVESEGVRIRLRKEPQGVLAGSPPVELTAPPAAPTSPPEAGSGGTEVAPAHAAEDRPEKDYYAVRSPIVGTFYRAPAPGADPFVEVGDFVEKGQVLCIVEAMKVMNEIEAPVAGKIVDILVQNGEPVEYGQVLFLIDTQASPG